MVQGEGVLKSNSKTAVIFKLGLLGLEKIKLSDRLKEKSKNPVAT